MEWFRRWLARRETLHQIEVPEVDADRVRRLNALTGQAIRLQRSALTKQEEAQIIVEELRQIAMGIASNRRGE